MNKTDSDKCTALEWARRQGHTQVVEKLIGLGAKPNVASYMTADSAGECCNVPRLCTNPLDFNSEQNRISDHEQAPESNGSLFSWFLGR